MTRASTGMLEKGTQTPSPAPDLIPARNRPRDGSLKAEIVSMEGCNENNSKCANRRLSQPRGSPQTWGEPNPLNFRSRNWLLCCCWTLN